MNYLYIYFNAQCFVLYKNVCLIKWPIGNNRTHWQTILALIKTMCRSNCPVDSPTHFDSPQSSSVWLHCPRDWFVFHVLCALAFSLFLFIAFDLTLNHIAMNISSKPAAYTNHTTHNDWFCAVLISRILMQRQCGTSELTDLVRIYSYMHCSVFSIYKKKRLKRKPPAMGCWFV